MYCHVNFLFGFFLLKVQSVQQLSNVDMLRNTVETFKIPEVRPAFEELGKNLHRPVFCTRFVGSRGKLSCMVDKF